MKTLRLTLLFLTVAVALSSCHSSRRTVRGSQGYRNRYVPVEQVNPNPPSKQPQSRSVAQLIKDARSWIGTPYSYGGNSRKGTDCSGFTCAIFDQSAGIKLPRSSREQHQWCKPVKRSQLRPGDLVFFVSKTGGTRINHVALYIGDGQIIHATTSRGVIESSLDENYWSSHFYGCGRVHGL
ncbi:MAG: C40 family peptidase [Odoribacter sp.]|nr:C40 family peptidase [Odoribacter sp.]